MSKMVLKQLPDGGYILLPENYSDLDLLTEVCTLNREKLKNFINKQVIENEHHCRCTRILDDHVFESRRLPLSSEEKGDVLRVMSWTYPSAQEDGVMLREERSSNKPPTMLTYDATNPKSALSRRKIIRSRETSDLLVAKEPKNNKTLQHQSSNPPPIMPVNFMNKILQLAVSKEKLLIQKTLTLSDVVKNQNRLSIPTKQLRCVKFLTDDEERLLSSHDGTNVGSLDNVMIIEPSLETSQVSFRRWEMRKGNDNNSISYVITKTWNEIRERNNLKEGMTLQVWGIRVDEKLWLALVKLP